MENYNNYRREKQLTLILAGIFERLPRQEDDLQTVWEKIGVVKSLVYWGLLGDGWLDLPLNEREDAVRETLPDLRKECALYLLPPRERGK